MKKSDYYYFRATETPFCAESGPETLEIYFTEPELASWQPPKFVLEVGRPRNDMMPNDAAWLLCSAKLRAVIDGVAGPNDPVRWLPVDVQQESETARYFLPHVARQHSVMHTNSFNEEGDVGGHQEPRIFGEVHR